METQTEFKDIEPSFNPISFSPLSVGTQITDAVLTFNVENKEILRIERNGNVIAPDLESASEAGRVFVQTVRDQLNFKL
jgi:hypothetical protein